jgi:hypothetical protein
MLFDCLARASGSTGRNNRRNLSLANGKSITSNSVHEPAGEIADPVGDGRMKQRHESDLKGFWAILWRSMVFLPWMLLVFAGIGGIWLSLWLLPLFVAGLLLWNTGTAEREIHRLTTLGQLQESFRLAAGEFTKALQAKNQLLFVFFCVALGTIGFLGWSLLILGRARREEPGCRQP